MAHSPGSVYQTSRTVFRVPLSSFFFKFENLGWALQTCHPIQPIRVFLIVIKNILKLTIIYTYTQFLNLIYRPFSYIIRSLQISTRAPRQYFWSRVFFSLWRLVRPRQDDERAEPLAKDAAGRQPGISH